MSSEYQAWANYREGKVSKFMALVTTNILARVKGKLDPDTLTELTTTLEKLTLKALKEIA